MTTLMPGSSFNTTATYHPDGRVTVSLLATANTLYVLELNASDRPRAGFFNDTEIVRRELANDGNFNKLRIIFVSKITQTVDIEVSAYWSFTTINVTISFNHYLDGMGTLDDPFRIDFDTNYPAFVLPKGSGSDMTFKMPTTKNTRYLVHLSYSGRGRSQRTISIESGNEVSISVRGEGDLSDNVYDISFVTDGDYATIRITMDTNTTLYDLFNIHVKPYEREPGDFFDTAIPIDSKGYAGNLTTQFLKHYFYFNVEKSKIYLFALLVYWSDRGYLRLYDSKHNLIDVAGHDLASPGSNVLGAELEFWSTKSEKIYVSVTARGLTLGGYPYNLKISNIPAFLMKGTPLPLPFRKLLTK